MKLCRGAVLCVLFLLVGKPAAGAPPDPNGIQTLSEYFDLIASGNYESAGMMWTESAQERASRFGISYAGNPLRVDATSPVVRLIDRLRGHLQPPVRQAQVLSPEFVRLEFSSIMTGRELKWNYFLQRVDGYYWLCYAEDYYAKDWPVQTSKYFRIHSHPDRAKFLNPVLLNEADRFIERIADSLQIDKKTLADMAARKIEYYYCDGDDAVKAITGVVTKGVYDLASNDVISSDFPHFHEIVHLLVNVKLKEVPLYTLPLLREGMAVRYGGRWGKRNSALADLGGFLIREKIVELDSILTARGFEEASTADIAYPVASVFTSYLVDKIGQLKYIDLYRSLSGDMDIVDTMNHIQVRRAFLGATGMAEWTDLLSDFDTYLTSGLARWSVASPGAAAKAKQVVADQKCIVLQNNEWVEFNFVSDSAGAPRGNFLFGRDRSLAEQHSMLFHEQYGDNQPFDGFRFGVRFDGNEAGLYDYATNELVAKYIWGITPSDQYFNPTDRTLRICFRKSLLGNSLPKANDYKLLPL